MPCTARGIASTGASLRMSMISARPPGRSTRCTSFKARTGRVKFLKAARQAMKSKDSGSNGMDAASATPDPRRKLRALVAGRADLDRDRVGAETLERQVGTGFLQVELHRHAGCLESVVDLADLARVFQHEADMEIRRIRRRG